MAFVDIRETGKSGLNSSRDDKQKLSVTLYRTFDLLSDAPTTDSDVSARNALQFNGLTTTGERIFEGAAHPENYYFRCSDISIERIGPISYTAKAGYKSPASRNPSDVNQDPVLEVPDVKWSTVTTDEAIDEDVNGDAIATATGELYQGITKSVSDLIVTISKNYAIFNPVTFYAFYNTVNAGIFMGFPAGTAKVMNLEASPVIEDDYLYSRVTVQIQFRKPYRVPDAQAWYKRMRHEGHYCFSPDPKAVDKKIRCSDANGDDSAQPEPLNEAGFQIKSTTEDHVWNTFEVYEESDFDAMNLGV